VKKVAFILAAGGLVAAVALRAEPPVKKDVAAAKAADADTAADAKTASTAKPAKGPRIGVEPSKFDFGKALQNKTLRKEFSIRNLGSEDLVISNVSTTCGCTVTDLVTPKTLKPGASTPLTVSLETRTVVGKLERMVTIVSNDPEGKPLMLTVSADVESNAGTGAPIPNVK
jgi:hypothetical protein